ncbi:MAG TPA: thiamine pyrophosphate-binding protein [Geminicoccaceae bacterium]|nr:thiamine pyrophosphate-binding protein [Geminicoccus sp.]HMU52620.1 thiamine pyrophosphate-binding protein [Geminicoccaceae bacterium]
MADNLRSGGRILVDQLRLHGVDLAFGVPGESYLDVLNAFYDAPELRFVICRQEGGVAMMAEAYGKLTGRPGIAFVTRGPGATNASAGVHVAQQDSTPMILFVGQIDSEARERDAFQEIDYRQMFRGIAKWAAEIDDAGRIPELVHRAFVTATSGRPGPVVLSLPENMLVSRSGATDGRRWQPVEAHPDPAAIADLRQMLAAASRPLVILGGGGWSAAAAADIRTFASNQEVPVAVSFRRQDYFDNLHPGYAGDLGVGVNPKLIERVRQADLLIAVGTRLSEIAAQGYTLLDIPRPKQRLVHIHADPAELGRVYQPDLAIQANAKPAAAALASLLPIEKRPWSAWTAAAHQDYLDTIQPVRTPGSLQMAEVMAHLGARLPEDAIVTNGAGNYAVWATRFRVFRHYRSQLAPTSGSMGYGLPAAVAAAAVHPDRTVVCFAGDGCFLMTGQELATAVQYGLKLLVLVVNNGMYGTIRMHQEREYPSRVSGTELRNPDFAALARAYGAFGARVERTADFPAALDEALAFDGPSLIELVLDPEALTIRASLSQIRSAAIAAGR